MLFLLAIADNVSPLLILLIPLLPPLPKGATSFTDDLGLGDPSLGDASFLNKGSVPPFPVGSVLFLVTVTSSSGISLAIL